MGIVSKIVKSQKYENTTISRFGATSNQKGYVLFKRFFSIYFSILAEYQMQTKVISYNVWLSEETKVWHIQRWKLSKIFLSQNENSHLCVHVANCFLHVNCVICKIRIWILVLSKNTQRPEVLRKWMCLWSWVFEVVCK